MTHRRWLQGILGIMLGVLCCASVLRAQDEENADDPTQGVARISVIQGEVNVKRGDSGEVVAAALNAPLMTQDHLQTGGGSRSEIQFDAANMVRLAPDTDVALADVQRGRYQLQLGGGTVIFRVLRDSQADAEIDTPSISIRPSGKGIVRVSVFPDGTTEVTVRSGTAAIYSQSGSQQLRSGQTMLARGTSTDPEFQIQAEAARDQFDDWSNTRDEQLLRSRSYQYVSTDIYGAEDLDAYGSWVTSSYGYVWAPRVESGWAPYHHGRWVWEDYYGWTWVDYAPWGWAPFHYGRWFMNGSAGWCWWPGARYDRYYWRPALVGFFGFGGGGGVSIGVGFGNVGWVPLAPHERWHPWYGRGWYGGGAYNRTIVNNTIIHNTNIYDTYRNARINNGVAYTNVNGFGRGSQAFYAASGAQIRNASLVRGRLPVTPERSSLAFTNYNGGARGLNYRQPSTRQFFSHTPLPKTERVPFSQQQDRMAQYQERTLGFRPTFSGQQAGNSPAARGYGSAPSQGNTYGQWNRPGAGINNGAQAGQNSGWRRFGQSSPSPGISGAPGGGWQRSPMNAPQTRMESRPAASGTDQRGYNRSNADNSAWHRFGAPEPNSAPRSSQRAAPQSDNNSGGWHRFGYPGDRGSSSGSSGNRQPARSSFGDPRGYSRPNRNDGGGSPMRMEQPIVHERPSYSAPRAPRAEPRYSAPRSNSAPQNNRHYDAPSNRGSRPAPSSQGGGGRGQRR
jgi:hypothetical protein